MNHWFFCFPLFNISFRYVFLLKSAFFFIALLFVGPVFSYAQESTAEESAGPSAQEQRAEYERQLAELEREQLELQKTIEVPVVILDGLHAPPLFYLDIFEKLRLKGF